ncbi:S24 family peptidase [Psittacicella hinzii]|uniref:Peptidase S24/S26A/S26B/S26C domain-containing protein n=1 Tax=Psittacicella hinzii TaxID=2028575 RepID=A0A3A1YP54_9GAMM|nr:S24 family peptidase [Psittacicella hinzii]RIY38740.1 hypothetical protein CKF58_03515 [Psittacicella hinzii]
MATTDNQENLTVTAEQAANPAAPVKRGRGRPRKVKVLQGSMAASGNVGFRPLPNGRYEVVPKNPPIGAIAGQYIPHDTPGFFVEMIDIEASAGPGTYTDDYTSSQQVFISNYEYYRNLSNEDPKNLRVLKIRGDSMMPVLHDGQTCIVRLETTFTSSGIYVFTYRDVTYIKRLQRSGDTLVAISENSKYPPFIIESSENFAIHGKLVLGLDYTRL